MENDNLAINNDEPTSDDTHDSNKNVKSTSYDVVAIILMVFLGFGASFIYDNPSALQDVMIESIHDITYSTLSSFYSWYSWPNVA